MPHEIEAFARREELQRDPHELDHLVEAPRARRPEKRFQLRKGELDRIEIRTVGREEAKAGPDAFNRGLHLRLLVHRQVVEHDDVAGSQRRREHLLNVGEKRGIVDRPIENGRRVETVHA